MGCSYDFRGYLKKCSYASHKKNNTPIYNILVPNRERRRTEYRTGTCSTPPQSKPLNFKIKGPVSPGPLSYPKCGNPGLCTPKCHRPGFFLSITVGYSPAGCCAGSDRPPVQTAAGNPRVSLIGGHTLAPLLPGAPANLHRRCYH